MAYLQNQSLITTLGLGNGTASLDKVRVSDTDLVNGFLDSKLTAGTGVMLSLLNPGGDESFSVVGMGPLKNAVEITLAYTVTDEDIIQVDFLGTFIITLPLLADFSKTLTVITPSTSVRAQLRVPFSSGERIDGEDRLNIVAGTSRTIYPFADEWNII